MVFFPISFSGKTKQAWLGVPLWLPRMSQFSPGEKGGRSQCMTFSSGRRSWLLSLIGFSGFLLPWPMALSFKLQMVTVLSGLLEPNPCKRNVAERNPAPWWSWEVGLNSPQIFSTKNWLFNCTPRDYLWQSLVHCYMNILATSAFFYASIWGQACVKDHFI